MKLSRDVNGNKVLILDEGFSIQTNGNLPFTHRMTKETFNANIAQGEANSYVRQFGTDRQKQLFEL